METKICKECKLQKNINEFRQYRKKCKECEKREYKKYYIKTKKRRLELSKKYREENKQYYETYRKNNKKKMEKYNKNYYVNNKDKILKSNAEYVKERTKKDKIYKLKKQIRLMIRNSFCRKGVCKNKKTEKIVGCDLDVLYKYLLETYKKNYDYEWDGKEVVHIDHIIPLSEAKTEQEVIKLCHYKNLQLLKVKDNLQKHNKLNWELQK